MGAVTLVGVGPGQPGFAAVMCSLVDSDTPPHDRPTGARRLTIPPVGGLLVQPGRDLLRASVQRERGLDQPLQTRLHRDPASPRATGRMPSCPDARQDQLPVLIIHTEPPLATSPSHLHTPSPTKSVATNPPTHPSTGHHLGPPLTEHQSVSTVSQCRSIKMKVKPSLLALFLRPRLLVAVPGATVPADPSGEVESPPAVSDLPTAGDAGEPEDVVNSHIAAELEAQFGVPFEEGLARAEAQDEQFLELSRLEADLGTSLSGGFYIDHENGGEGVLTVTDVPAAQQVLSEADSAWAETVILEEVAASKNELEATRETSARELEAAGIRVEASFASAESNSVTIETAVSPTSTDAGEVVEGLSLPANAIVVEDITTVNLTACHPSEVYCDRLRGGEAIRNESSFSPGACTAGLPVRSKSDGKPYVITAGHCVEGLGPHWLSAFANATNQGRWGTDHISLDSSQGIDVGLIAVVNSSVI